MNTNSWFSQISFKQRIWLFSALAGILAIVKYTSDRSENFDIYLPKWIAKNNMWIFGLTFVAGLSLVTYNLFTFQ